MVEVDGSEDVNDFLQRIRELGDKRDKEDGERTRRLEDEILQGRKERQARRAERARSISPTKNTVSNSSTPTSFHAKLEPTTLRKLSSMSTDSYQASPSPVSTSAEFIKESTLASKLDDLTLKETETTRVFQPTPVTFKPAPSPSFAVPSSRANNLSWQQRPGSRGAIAAENKIHSASSPSADIPTLSLQDEKELSRSQIAQSLGAKDPTWFRQTADRGLGSAAYRKAQDDTVSETSSLSGSMRLPGLSREPTTEPDHVRSSIASREGSVRGSTAWSQRTNEASTSITSTISSALPEFRSQRFEPPLSDAASSQKSEVPVSHTLAMSPSQGRISPERLERPSSPTKGLGSFVQSAMLKRSDSVNKRWSAQPGSGLSRGNSIASNRSALDGMGAISSSREVRVNTLSREVSPISVSRPTSSHGIIGASEGNMSSEKSIKSAKASTTAVGFIKPPPPSKSASLTHNPLVDDRPETPTPTDTGVPVSPSKTMESKRWSPTKASWLESAINKPDSPKPRVAPQQPSWMAEINKAKIARGITEVGKSTSSKEIVSSGSIHSPSVESPMISPNLGSLAVFPSLKSKARRDEVALEDTEPGIQEADEEISLAQSGTLDQQSNTISPSTNSSANLPKSPALSTSLTSNTRTAKSPGIEIPLKSPIPAKAKPNTPPKKDFRSVLKSRQLPGEKQNAEEPEFRNVFGKLKPTETKNYVAPDELKGNILRGKAGLAVTGGPKKTERIDELKESILKKKEEMKAGGPPSVGRKISGSSIDRGLGSPPPEAIAKQRGLVRAENLVTKSNSRVQKDIALTDGDVLLSRRTLLSPSKSPIAESGKSADQFNTALANILSRGPPVGETVPSTRSKHEMRRDSVAGDNIEGAAGGAQLIHITKDRARGPKRRLPTAAKLATSLEFSPSSADQSTPKPFQNTSKSMTTSPSGSLTTVMNNPLSKPLANITNNSNKPVQPRSSPEPTNPIKQQPIQDLTIQSADSRPNIVNEKIQKPKRSTPGEKQPPMSPDSSSMTIPSEPRQLLPSTNSSPVKAYKPKSQVALGLGSSTLPRLIESPKLQSVSPPSLLPKIPRSPPIPQKPDSLLNRVVSNVNLNTPTTVESASLELKGSEALRFFAEFFGEVPFLNLKISVDAQAVLPSYDIAHESGKIKTLRKQMWEVTGDSKRVPVPAHQEHILFEDCMYLCSHVFGSPSGKRTTEVYLWHGDGVSPSSVEDAQLFSRNAAKEAGGKLIVLRQGKESSNFFEALGGIVITRRGSSSRSESTTSAAATYMLCGRQHMGQIAFDEVAFRPSSLCSGFPYIVSATSGRLYLWKGKGSGADELGCARLIGMDLGLTGEIEEIDEGKEPEGFWNAFPVREQTTFPTADHWPFKQSSDKYATRLFEIDLEARPKSSSGFKWGMRSSTPVTTPGAEDTLTAQVKELSPFVQTDLTPTGIFVLDAFFEIYVIVGASATSKFPTFRAALLFAQEYGILAASMQDRPFIPVSHVVLEGAPTNMKSAFRKWDERCVVTRGCKSGAARVVLLNESLEALSG